MRGSRIGDRYRVIAPLAEGGMGRVWLAEDERTGDPLVIKQVRAPDDVRLRRLFGRELRTVARFEHPRIVRIRDVGRTNAGLLWYAMDRVDGESLARWADPRRTWPEIARVVDDLLAALAHAHARDVLHLDVKPDNILVDTHGRASLVDFGVARLTTPGVAVLEGLGPRPLRPLPGTPAWMSPEQIRGDEHLLGPATDLYAVGCILAELVTGSHPWPASSAEAWMARHLTAPMPTIATRDGRPVPPALVALIRDLLERHARSRACCAAMVRKRLAQVPTFDLPPRSAVDVHELSRGDTLDTATPLGALHHAGDGIGTHASTIDGPTPFAMSLRSALVHLRATPMIGREPLVHELLSALGDTLEGASGSVHVVLGRPDDGARAIVEAAGRHVAEAGLARRISAPMVTRFGVPDTRLRAALCRAVGFRSPPGPRIGGWFADRFETDDLADVQPLVAWLDRQLPDGTPTEQRGSTHAALAMRVLRALCGDGPALIVIPDAETIDDPIDLAILDAVTRPHDGPPVHLLVGAPDLSALPAPIARLARAQGPRDRAATASAAPPWPVTVHPVAPLDPDACIELCETLLPMTRPAAAAFVEHIGGAPIALHRCIVDAVDASILVEQGDLWHFAVQEPHDWLERWARHEDDDERAWLLAPDDADPLRRDVLVAIALLGDLATDTLTLDLLTRRGLSADIEHVARCVDEGVRRRVLFERRDGGVRLEPPGLARHVVARMDPGELRTWCDPVRAVLSPLRDHPGADVLIADLLTHARHPQAVHTVRDAATAAWARGDHRVAARLIDRLYATAHGAAWDHADAVEVARIDVRVSLSTGDRARLDDARARLEALAAAGCASAGAWAQDARGMAALALGLPAEAAEALEAAEAAHRACGHSDDVRRVRVALADALRRLGQYDEAEALCEQLLGADDAVQVPGRGIDVLHILAFVALETARYDRALDVTADALGRVDAATPRHQVALTRRLRAGALLRLDRVGDAIDEARAALAMVRALGARLEEAALHNLLGMCHFEQGDHGHARSAGAAALAISEDLGEVHLRGRILNNLALACDRLGRTDEATRHFEAAVAWSVRADDPQNEARTVYNMARRYAATDAARAAALAQRSLELLETLGLPYADDVARWLETLDDDTPPDTRAESVRAWYRAWGAPISDGEDAPAP